MCAAKSKASVAMALSLSALWGCQMSGGEKPQNAPSETATSCELPRALRGQWHVGETVAETEYQSSPKSTDQILITCEGGPAQARIVVRFKGATDATVRFQDFTDIPLRYFAKGTQLSSTGVQKFTTQADFRKYFQEVTQGNYDYLIGSGILHSGVGDHHAIAVVAILVPWTLTTSAGETQERLTFLFANMDEIAWTGTPSPTSPNPALKQGGVIHGRK